MFYSYSWCPALSNRFDSSAWPFTSHCKVWSFLSFGTYAGRVITDLITIISLFIEFFMRRMLLKKHWVYLLKMMLQLLQVKQILLQSSDHLADPIPGPFCSSNTFARGSKVFLLWFLSVCNILKLKINGALVIYSGLCLLNLCFIYN